MKQKKREPLASAFELAEVAVGLARLKGYTEPDVEGAVALLKRCAFRVQDEKLPCTYYAQAAMFDTPNETEIEAIRKAMKDWPTEVQTRESHPSQYKQMLEMAKAFPGADKITPPSKYPAASKACWRAVLRRSPSVKEIQRATESVLKSDPHAASYIHCDVSSEFGFWSWAGRIIRHLQSGRTRSKAKTRRSRKGDAAGQYTKPMHGKSGKFIKKT